MSARSHSRGGTLSSTDRIDLRLGREPYIATDERHVEDDLTVLVEVGLKQPRYQAPTEL